MAPVFVVVPLSLGAQYIQSSQGCSRHQAHRPLPAPTPNLSLWAPFYSQHKQKLRTAWREASLSGTQSQVSSATLLPAATGLAEQLPVDIGGGVCNQRILALLLAGAKAPREHCLKQLHSTCRGKWSPGGKHYLLPPSYVKHCLNENLPQ